MSCRWAPSPSPTDWHPGRGSFAKQMAGVENPLSADQDELPPGVVKILSHSVVSLVLWREFP